jgi:hypothetical protein
VLPAPPPGTSLTRAVAEGFYITVELLEVELVANPDRKNRMKPFVLGFLFAAVCVILAIIIWL